MSLDSLLTETMLIERDTGARDTLGGHTETWGTVATDVKCRLIQPESRQGAKDDAATVGRAAAFVNTYILTGESVDIVRGDRITIDSDIFDVTYVGKIKKGASAAHHKRAIVERHT